eukprot:5462391-Pyramimonas_sp.AAC.1
MGIALLRRASKSFPTRTAVGADAFRPRHWALLSHPALSMLGYIFYLCEQWPLWPSPMQFVHVVLLGKPTGGYRPIALLVSLCRVWAKARIGYVRQWA